MGHRHTRKLSWLCIKAAFGPCTHRLAPWSTLWSASFLLPELFLPVPWEGKLVLGRKTSTLQGSIILVLLQTTSLSESGPVWHRKARSACCLLLLYPFHTRTQSNRKKELQKRLNSLSDTHYFILVFPFHFWEIYAVVVWLRLQFLSFFILAFIGKEKREKYRS